MWLETVYKRENKSQFYTFHTLVVLTHVKSSTQIFIGFSIWIHNQANLSHYRLLPLQYEQAVVVLTTMQRFLRKPEKSIFLFKHYQQVKPKTKSQIKTNKPIVKFTKLVGI